MKKTVLFGLQAIMLVLVLVIIGCDNGMTNDGNRSPQDEIAIVKISLPIYNARSTSTDELISQTTGYRLEVTKDEVLVYNGNFAANQSIIQIELTPGIHIFTLEALKETEILGTGTITATLVAGVNTVEIILFPIMEEELVTAEIKVKWATEANLEYQFNDGSEIWGMALDNSGGLYLTGRYASLDTGPLNYTAYLDNNLNRKWYNSDYGGERWACSSNGINGYIIGWGGPVVKFSSNSQIPSVISDGNGFGYGITTDTLGNTYFYNNDGVRSLSDDLQTIRWTYVFPDFEIISSHIICGGDGFIYFVGVDWDTRKRGFIVKLDPNNGNEVWKGYFDTADNAQDARIAVNTDGMVMVSAGNEFTSRWNSSGTKLSNLSYIPMLTSFKINFYGLVEGVFSEFNHNGDIITEYKNIGLDYYGYGGEILVEENYLYVGGGNIVKKYLK
jgi:hypothetical protein